jgi:predicted ArsR family transcriptional regulator
VMLQLSIFDSAPGVRRSDPRTSHEAAASAKDLQARHHRLIVACLKEHGPASKDRIAALTCLTGTQVARRTTELERAGLIRDTGDKARSTAGRAERVWGAV